MDQKIAALRDRVRDVPDFPKPGIVFKDITPILADPTAFRDALSILGERVALHKPNALAAIESRGFLFGAPLARQLGVSLILVRKPGKLPYHTRKVTYDLEYGSDTLEMHVDAVAPGMRVVVVDDVLATGGTAGATARLIEEHGGKVSGLAFFIELAFLGGRTRLGSRSVDAVISY